MADGFGRLLRMLGRGGWEAACLQQAAGVGGYMPACIYFYAYMLMYIPRSDMFHRYFCGNMHDAQPVFCSVFPSSGCALGRHVDTS